MTRLTPVLLLGFFLATIALACGGRPALTSPPEPTDTPTLLPAATSNAARDVARGKRLAQEKGCLGCHTTDGRN